jgi:hypothetical protein
MTGEPGNVADADAPQAGFGAGAVMKVVESDFDGSWFVDIAQDMACEVPPTELNRTTSPSREAVEHIRSPTMARTILFTATPNSERMHATAMELNEETESSAPLERLLVRARADGLRYLFPDGDAEPEVSMMRSVVQHVSSAKGPVFVLITRSSGSSLLRYRRYRDRK